MSARTVAAAASCLKQGTDFDRLGRWKEAVECYDRALEIDPGMVPAWSHKGNSLQQIGRKEDALICFKRALEIDGTYAKAWIGKGDVLSNSLLDAKGGTMLEISNKKDLLHKINVLDEAIEAYRNFISFAPPELRAFIRQTETRCEQLHEARKFITKLLNS